MPGSEIPPGDPPPIAEPSPQAPLEVVLWVAEAGASGIIGTVAYDTASKVGRLFRRINRKPTRQWTGEDITTLGRACIAARFGDDALPRSLAPDYQQIGQHDWFVGWHYAGDLFEAKSESWPYDPEQIVVRKERL